MKTPISLLAICIFLFVIACSNSTTNDNGETSEIDGYTVKFNSMGGNYTPPDQIVGEGETATEPAEPTKQGERFVGWYRNFATDTPPYDFAAPVTGDLTLYAGWNADMITITFISEGLVMHNEAVVEGRILDNRDDMYVPSMREGFIFEGWYIDSSLAAPVTFPRTLHYNTTFYAKWGALADFDGVWTRSGNPWGGQTSLLVIDENGGWFFEERGASVYAEPVSWNLTPISLNIDKDVLTLDLNGPTPLTKTSEEKSPTMDSPLAGFWANNDGLSLDLKDDGTAEIMVGDNEPFALVYAAEVSKLYLLREASPHYVLLAIPIAEDRLAGFTKILTDRKLLGTWEISSVGSRAAYTFRANGEGTYYALGASLLFNYTLAEEDEGYSLQITQGRNDYGYYRYQISEDGDTLTVQGESELSYHKLPSPPDYPATHGGDSDLYNVRWGAGGSTTVIFESFGLFYRVQTSSARIDITSIWKAEDGQVTFYNPDIGSSTGGEPVDYSITTGFPRTLRLGGENFQEPAFAPTYSGLIRKTN
jgi:uncharacterized repeat protein (TIGR02543 family)